MGRKKKIVIACGGTAGHIFPGLTLAEEMAKDYGDDVEISFLTTDNDLGRGLLEKSGFDFYTLPVRGWGVRSLRGALDFARGLIGGSLKSMKLMISARPDCFVGFGAYAAGPPFVASSLLRVPTLIHEQNVTMGKANRMMRAFATKVALSFPEERGVSEKKAVVTGNPIRESASRAQDRHIARDLLGMDAEKTTLLVVGGSQGSEKVNTAVLEALFDADGYMKDNLQVIHVTGQKDRDRVIGGYEKVAVPHRLFSFFEGMAVLYGAADIAVSRAGSSAIFELCAHRVPSILIPYPFADGHQAGNASFLRERGAAAMIEEKDLSAASLRTEILRLMRDNGLRESMKGRMAELATSDAARRLSLEVGMLAGLKESRNR